MSRRDEDRQFLFRFHCPDFELEFQGDEEFVRHQLKKYEFRILEKLDRILEAEKRSLKPEPASKQKSSKEAKTRKKSSYKKKKQNRSLEKAEREPDYLYSDLSAPEAKEPEPELELDLSALREFYQGYHPQTHHDRVMLIAYFLSDQGRKHFSSQEVSFCYQALGERLPGNLSLILNNASRSGFLTKEEQRGKIKYQLSLKGKRYVENGLRLD